MRLNARTLGACVALVLAASVVEAQDVPAIFSRLDGRWRGSGTLLGRDARFEMSWEDRGPLAVLTFSNAFVAADGGTTPVLSAAAIYRTSPEAAEAVWLDSRGVRIEITWTATDSTLVANWTAPNETGRTTYRAVSPDEIETIDEVTSGASPRTFATGRLRRVSAPD